MASRRHHYDFDLIIIGSGAGGGIAAHVAANAGHKVAIVEEDKIGGECPNYGCIPTKALLRSAEVYDIAKNGDQYGLRTSTIGFSLPKVTKWKDLSVMHTGVNQGERVYGEEGITLLKGHAHFIDSRTVNIARKRYSAKNFLIATGSSNFTPPIEGLEEAGFITHREVFTLSSPPKSLFIIGGGTVGCEFSQMLSIFGSKIQIAEMEPHLLPREDRDIGDLVEALFETKRDIRVFASAKVVGVEKKAGKKIIYYKKNGQIHSAKVDEILVAAGKIPNTDLGLENAGVQYGRGGIIVNSRMQTSAKHIYATGDVTGKYMFTHTASYQSKVAVHNIFHRDKVVAKYHAVPRVVFLSPEVAAVGISEEQAREKKMKINVGFTPISVLGRANTSGLSDGFVKVIALKKSGVIVGASIVSPHAGEMIHELALAVNHGLTVQHIESTIHAFPTWSEAVHIACAKIA